MASKGFTWQSFLLRFAFSLLLVFLTYNPSGYSFYHWAHHAAVGEGKLLSPPLVLAAIVLLIGWAVYVNATLRSLGGFGMVLAVAFFAVLVWWLIDLGLFGLESFTILSVIVLFLIAALLAVGMSWSHIRRRMSGQIDVDEVDD